MNLICIYAICGLFCIAIFLWVLWTYFLLVWLMNTISFLQNKTILHMWMNNWKVMLTARCHTPLLLEMSVPCSEDLGLVRGHNIKPAIVIQIFGYQNNCSKAKKKCSVLAAISHGSAKHFVLAMCRWCKFTSLQSHDNLTVAIISFSNMFALPNDEAVAPLYMLGMQQHQMSNLYGYHN